MQVGRDVEGCLEPVRKQAVGSMRVGENFVLAYGNVDPHFAEWQKVGFFSPESLFDFANWRKEENFMKVVRPEDTEGTGGVFVCQERFNVIVTSTYTTDEAMHAFIAQLPHKDQFNIYIVN